MRKLLYLIITSLTLGLWACKDDTPIQIVYPDVTVNAEEFVDPRDGKIYHTFTIGDQTWMVENLAFRLDSGSWAGCYTYNEILATYITEAELKALYDAYPLPELYTLDDFIAAVDAAVANGTISDPDAVDVVGYMRNYVNLGYVTSVDQYMNGPGMYGIPFWVGIYPNLAQTLVPKLEQVIQSLTDPFEMFKNKIREAIKEGVISSDYSDELWMSPADVLLMGFDYGFKSIDDYMDNWLVYYTDPSWYPLFATEVVPIVYQIIDDVNSSLMVDPFELFKEKIEEAKADGRISNELIPDFFFTYAGLVDMAFMYGFNTIADYMDFMEMYALYYDAIEEVLMPVLRNIVKEVENETSWPPVEVKEAILAEEVKRRQDIQLELAERMNNNYSEEYGYLYTLEGARKAVPEGWRIPTDADWKKLEKALGMTDAECNEFETWRGGAPVSDWFKSADSEFKMKLAGGKVYSNLNASGIGADYINKDLNAYYLTNTRMQLNDSTTVSLIRSISIFHDGVLRATSHVSAAHSVRLIKDDGTVRDDDDLIHAEGSEPNDALNE